MQLNFDAIMKNIHGKVTQIKKQSKELSTYVDEYLEDKCPEGTIYLSVLCVREHTSSLALISQPASRRSVTMSTRLYNAALISALTPIYNVKRFSLKYSESG